MVRLYIVLAIALAVSPLVAAPPKAPPLGKIVRFERASLYLPAAAAKAKVPLLVVFPGSGGSADPIVRSLRPAADAAGFALLGFSPGGENFDVIDRFFDDREAHNASAWVEWPQPTFGGETARNLLTIDHLTALGMIDSSKVGLLGFSHGGSYALTLGLSQPARFRSMIALSPGILLIPPGVHGGQAVFLAHGRSDSVQPYSRTACNFVPKLTSLGYRVRFSGFEGTHEVKDAVLHDALVDFVNVVSGADKGVSDSGRSTADCKRN